MPRPETTPSVAESVVKLTCAKQHQPVSQLEAEAAIDKYLGMTSGAQPKNAWSLPCPGMQRRFGSQDAFAAEFENVLWYERFSDITPVRKAFDRFTVPFLAFTGSNPEHPDTVVSVYTRQVQLTRSDTVTLIRDIAAAQRDDTLEWRYPAVHTAATDEVPGDARLRDPVDPVDFRGRSDAGAWPAQPPHLHGPDNEGTWVYAPGSGWIPDRFLDGGNRDLLGMADCDQHLFPNAAPARPTTN